MDLFSGPGLGPPPPLRPFGPPLPGLHREHAALDALATMEAIQGSTLIDRYRSLLETVARRGYRTKGGAVLYGLTDYEAAALLKVERSSVNAARNGLMNREPTAVTKGPKRRCHYRPSNQDVNEWRLASPLAGGEGAAQPPR